MCGGATAHLSPQIARMMALLITMKGRSVTYDRLLHAGWDGRGELMLPRTVSMLLWKLRRSLCNLGCETRIVTDWGYGAHLSCPSIGFVTLHLTHEEFAHIAPQLKSLREVSR
jgi:DNA-binding response OmpR family regulator